MGKMLEQRETRQYEEAFLTFLREVYEGIKGQKLTDYEKAHVTELFSAAGLEYWWNVYYGEKGGEPW